MSEVFTAGLVSAAVGVLFVALGLFGRGMNPDHAALTLPLVLLLSVVIMAVDSYSTRKRM